MKAHVYTAYGEQSVLYIGSTDSLPKRLGTHARKAPWWGQLVRIETTEYDSLPEARDAEVDRIRAMRPDFNIIHNVGLPTIGPVHLALGNDPTATVRERKAEAMRLLAKAVA